MNSENKISTMEAAINSILDKIIMFYLNNTNDGKRILALLQEYSANFNAYLSSCAPKEKLLSFLQKQSEYLEKLSKTMNNINQFTNRLNEIIETIPKQTNKIQAWVSSLPYRFKRWWYTHDINPFSAIWNNIIMPWFIPYKETHEYKRIKAQQEIDRIEQHRDVHFGDIEAKWYAKNFPNGIQERDIINNSNSILCLSEKDIKQAISFKVFDPALDSYNTNPSPETYNICICKEKNGSYTIWGFVRESMFDQERSLEKKYNKDGKLAQSDNEPMNLEQKKISTIIDSINNEFKQHNCNIDSMYQHLEDNYHKRLSLSGKNMYVLNDNINTAKKKDNNTVVIKKIFNSPGFGYYPLSLETTEKKIRTLLK